eukprot:6213430-Pleurochrysis_carterae.AAC.5
MAGSMPPLRSNSPRGVFAISKGMMGLDSFPDVIGPDAAARRAQVPPHRHSGSDASRRVCI